MKRTVLLAAMMLGILVSGCATYPKDDIDVATEADPKVNFSGYKTYAWLGSVQILNDPQGTWEPMGFDADTEITALVDKELAKRRMIESDSNPDMLVAYALGVDMDSMQYKDNPNAELAVLENVPQGALVIVMMDPETQFVTWAGIAVAEVKNMGQETAVKRLNYAISKMFKELPK